MSILKATKSITTFDVSGIPEVDGVDIIQNVQDTLNAYKIADMQAGEEIVWGWTSLLNSYKPEFNDGSFLTGEFVTVGLRIDRKTVPAKVIAKEVYLAEEAVLYEKQIPKLGRAMKVMIKETVKAKLFATAPAVPTTYDVIWNVNEQKLYLFSTQKLAREVIEEMFLECFNLTVTQQFPFTMAEKTVDEDEIAKLSVTSFI